MQKILKKVIFANHRWVAGLLVATALLVGAYAAPNPSRTQKGPTTPATMAKMKSLLNLPLSFELNQGQTDAKVKYLTRAQNFTVFLTSAGDAVMQGQNADVLRMKLQNANPSARAEGEDRQLRVSNYYIGSDRSKWLKGVPNFGSVRYRDVYSGIDVVYHSDQRQLEYDFVVNPGADPNSIRVLFDGAAGVSLTSAGELQLESVAGTSVHHKPVVYQMINGQRKAVHGEYALVGRTLGFKIGDYDHSKPLTIDPIVQVISFFGGVLNDEAAGVATSAVQASPTTAGVVFVGRTQSAGLPGATNTKPGLSIDWDGFATGLNGGTAGSAPGAATTILWTTYFGGNADDAARGVAMDNQGNAYVVGYTNSSNFPAGQPSGYDAFVLKLAAAGGAITGSTLYGGPLTDQGTSIALDFSTFSTLGNAISITNPSTDPRVTPNVVIGGLTLGEIGLAGSPAGSKAPDGHQTSAGATNGTLDGFVAILSSSLSVIHATYIGGTGNDQVNGVAADIWGNIYATGYATPIVAGTASGFPIVNGIAQTSQRKNWDASLGPAGSAVPFVAKWACTVPVGSFAIGVTSPPFGFTATNPPVQTAANNTFPVCGGMNNLKTLSNSALFGGGGIGGGAFINPQQTAIGQQGITEAGYAIAVDNTGWGQAGVSDTAQTTSSDLWGIPNIVPVEPTNPCNLNAAGNNGLAGTNCAVSASNVATTGGFEPGVSGPHVYVVGNTFNRDFVNSLVFNASCAVQPWTSQAGGDSQTPPPPPLCPVPEVWGGGVTIPNTLPGSETNISNPPAGPFEGPFCDPLTQLTPGNTGYNPSHPSLANSTVNGITAVCPAGGEPTGDLRVKLATGGVNSGQSQGWLAAFQFPAITQVIVSVPGNSSNSLITTLNPPTIPNYIVLQPLTCPPQLGGCVEGEVPSTNATPPLPVGNITTASTAPPANLGCAVTGVPTITLNCPTPYIGSWNAVAVDSDMQVYVLGQIGQSFSSLGEAGTQSALFGSGPPDRLALEMERITPYSTTTVAGAQGNGLFPNFCPGSGNVPCAFPEPLFMFPGDTNEPSTFGGSTTLLIDVLSGSGGGANSILNSSYGQILPGAPPFPNPSQPGGLGNGIAVSQTREAFLVGTTTVITPSGNTLPAEAEASICVDEMTFDPAGTAGFPACAESNTTVTAIQIEPTAATSLYASLPTCTITGGGGSGATCSLAAGGFTLQNGVLTPPAGQGLSFACSACVTAGGLNYTSFPTVTLTPAVTASAFTAFNYDTLFSLNGQPLPQGNFGGTGGANAGLSCAAASVTPDTDCSAIGDGPEDVLFVAVQFFDAIATLGSNATNIINFTASVNSTSSVTGPNGLTGSLAVYTFNYLNWEGLPLGIPPGCTITANVPNGRDGVNSDFTVVQTPGLASWTVAVNTKNANTLATPGVSTSLVTFTKGSSCTGFFEPPPPNSGVGLDGFDPLTLTLTVEANMTAVSATSVTLQSLNSLSSVEASGIIDQFGPAGAGLQLFNGETVTIPVNVTTPTNGSTAPSGGVINFTAQIVPGPNWPSIAGVPIAAVPTPTDIIYEAPPGQPGSGTNVPLLFNPAVLAPLLPGTYTALLVLTPTPETPLLPNAGSQPCTTAFAVPPFSGSIGGSLCFPISITINATQVSSGGVLVLGSSTTAGQTSVTVSNPSSAPTYNFTAAYVAAPIFGNALPAAYVTLTASNAGPGACSLQPGILSGTVIGALAAGGSCSLPVNVNPSPTGLPLLPTGVYSGQVLFSSTSTASGATPQTTVPIIVYVGPHPGDDPVNNLGLGLMLPVNLPPVGTGGSQGTGFGCPSPPVTTTCAGGYPLTFSVPAGSTQLGPIILEVTDLDNVSSTAYGVSAPKASSSISSFVSFTNPGADFGTTAGSCAQTFGRESNLNSIVVGPSCAWSLWINAPNIAGSTTPLAACGTAPNNFGVQGDITFTPSPSSAATALVVPLTICVTDTPALQIDTMSFFPNFTQGPGFDFGVVSQTVPQPSNVIPGFPESIVSTVIAESNSVTAPAIAPTVNLIQTQGNSTPVCTTLSIETNGGFLGGVTIQLNTGANGPFLILGPAPAVFTTAPSFASLSGSPTGGISQLGSSFSALPGSPFGPFNITGSPQIFDVCADTDEIGNGTGTFSGSVIVNSGGGVVTIPVNLIVTAPGNGTPGGGTAPINNSEIGVFRSTAPFGSAAQPAGFVLNEDAINQLGGGYNFATAFPSNVVLAPFGLAGDTPVAGDWTGSGVVRIGVFRCAASGPCQWILDLNNNGIFDGTFGGDGIFIFGQAGDIPVVGDWNGSGQSKFGIFRPSTGQFILDFLGHMTFDNTAVTYSFGLAGDVPVAGNWNGGKADFIGIWRPSSGLFVLDTTGTGTFSAASAIYQFGQMGDIPVVGNWGNSQPVQKRIGVFRPAGGLWILSTPANNNWIPTDPVFQFGEAGDMPVTGFWTIP